jgi:hypothetical protein
VSKKKIKENYNNLCLPVCCIALDFKFKTKNINEIRTGKKPVFINKKKATCIFDYEMNMNDKK